MNPSDFIKTLDHHAYFIHAFENGVQKIKEFLKKEFNVEHKQNPDFYHEKFETFGIDESRRLKDLHSSKSFTEGGKRIFMIETSNMTHEAQNSLLKIFEEPNEDSHFFLIMPSIEVLLPTLRSRLSIIKSNGDYYSAQAITDAESFLKLSEKARIDFVNELAKRISDESATKSEAQEFLAALELVFYKKNGVEQTRGLNAILKARDYMNDRSPSVKQLLEYVALTV